MAFIRSRQIETELRNRGTEQGTLYVLQVLAEQQIALQKDARSMASMLNQMMDILANVVTVGENMKSVINQLNHDGGDDDQGLDLNTQQLDKN